MGENGNHKNHYGRCLESLIEVFLYIDGQVEASRNEEIEAHLDNCARCYGRVEFERLLKSYIKQKSSYEECDPQLLNIVLEIVDSE